MNYNSFPSCTFLEKRTRTFDNHPFTPFFIISFYNIQSRSILSRYLETFTSFSWLSPVYSSLFSRNNTQFCARNNSVQRFLTRKLQNSILLNFKRSKFSKWRMQLLLLHDNFQNYGLSDSKSVYHFTTKIWDTQRVSF